MVGPPVVDRIATATGIGAVSPPPGPSTTATVSPVVVDPTFAAPGVRASCFALQVVNTAIVAADLRPVTVAGGSTAARIPAI